MQEIPFDNDSHDFSIPSCLSHSCPFKSTKHLKYILIFKKFIMNQIHIHNFFDSLVNIADFRAPVEIFLNEQMINVVKHYFVNFHVIQLQSVKSKGLHFCYGITFVAICQVCHHFRCLSTYLPAYPSPFLSIRVKSLS